MRRYRRVSSCFSLLIIISLLLGMCITGAWGADKDIEIYNYWTTPSSLDPGDEFHLMLNLRNPSETDPISIKSMELSGSSFLYQDSANAEIPVNITLGVGEQESKSIQLKYIGGSGTISLDFTYTKGGGEEKTEDHDVFVTIKGEDSSSNNGSSSSENTGSKTPILAVQDKQVIETTAGAETELKLRIKNMSSYTGKEVLVKVSLEGDAPITFSGEQMFYNRNWSSNSSKTITLNMLTEKTAKTGTYTLQLDYEGVNSYGDSFSSSETLRIRITDDNPPPRLVFTPKTDGQQLIPGEAYNLVISAANRGGLTAKDVSIDLGGLSNEGIALTTGSSRQYIDTLMPGQERFVYYTVKPASDMKDGSYSLDITVTYRDESGSSHTDEQEIFLSVGDGKSDINGVPKIIINRYDSYPVIVEAGDNFTLNMSFLNTHSNKQVQNIKVVLSIDESSETGNVFTPVNASNTFYIEKIEPRETVQTSLELYTIPDAKPRTYSITATIEYEDDEGEERKSEEVIGIPVKQYTSLDIGDIEVWGGSPVGEPVPVSCEMYNTGRTKLRNLIVKLEGPFETERGTVFYGNLDEGSMDYFDGTVIPTEPGNITGNIIFSYEDEAGEPVVIEKEFTFEAVEYNPENDPMMNPDMMDPDMNAEGWFKTWYLAFPAVLVIGLVIFIIRRRKKKKEEEMMFDE